MGFVTAIAVADDAPSDSKPQHTIFGTVVLPDKSPASEASVSYTYYDGRRIEKNFTTDQTGRFRFSIPATHFHNVIWLQSSDGKYRRLANVSLPKDIGDWEQDVEINLDDCVLEPLKSVSVSVVGEADEPVKDAQVVVQAGWRIIDRMVTGNDGKATVSYPGSVHAQTVGAYKKGIGIDYATFEPEYKRRGEGSPHWLPKGFDGDITLKLDGLREAFVSVIGPDGKPMAGVTLRPWLIRRPNHGEEWNLPGMEDFKSVSDENGVAQIDLVPHDQEYGITCFPEFQQDDLFAVDRTGMGERASVVWKKGDTATMLVLRKLTVSGRVTKSDGTPAAGITVHGNGGFRYTGWFNERTKTDAGGKWQMQVWPNGYYLFTIRDNEWAAKAHEGVVIREKDSPRDMDFVLETPKRIFGQVTGNMTKPVRIMLQQHAPNYYDLPKEKQLPEAPGNRGVSAFLQQSLQVDEDGKFEFKVGPGKYVIWDPERETQKFDLKAEESGKEFKFHLEHPLEHRVTINVIDSRGMPVSNAKIVGLGLEDHFEGRVNASTNKDGKVSVTVRSVKIKVVASSLAGRMKGSAEFGPSDSDVTIRVTPSASAVGRLVDENGKPVAGKTIEYGIELKNEEGLMTRLTRRSTKTGPDGSFKLESLCVGEKQDVDIVGKFDEQGDPNSWNSLTEFTPKTTRVDLGDVISKH